MAVMDAMNRMGDEGTALVNRFFSDVAEEAAKDGTDPQAAADALAALLEPVATEVAELAGEENTKAFEAKAYALGLALGAAQNAIDDLGDAAREKIDYGLFIIHVFGKGVEMVSGQKGISKGVDKVGKFLGDDEKATVKNWEDKLKNAAEVLVKKAIKKRSGALDEETESQRVTDFKQGLKDGREEARKARGRT
jgi:hypothetical protein